MAQQFPTSSSPNNRIRIALAGLRGRGRDHISGFGRMPGVEIATLCDVDETVLDARLADVEKLTVKRPARHIEFRKVLEDKSIDVVTTGTQNRMFRRHYRSPYVVPEKV